jgi:hypothetical protein
VFTSVMTEDFRPVSPTHGPGLSFTARIEIDPTPDGGTHYRAIAMHADEIGYQQHADMGFAERLECRARSTRCADYVATPPPESWFSYGFATF